MEADTLLTNNDGTDAGGGTRFGQGVERIRKQKLHAFALENFRCSLRNIHRPLLNE
jgi:hypothetical protein